jgi:hypothetical protein
LLLRGVDGVGRLFGSLPSLAMRSPKRLIAVILAALALAVPALSIAGCGSGSHYVGGVVAHHALNHLAPNHQRGINKFFCLYHGHRVLVDLTHHHAFVAGLNAIAAYNACKHGFGRRY